MANSEPNQAALQPPKTKKPRLDASSSGQPSSKIPLRTAEFSVGNLENFYKPCPNYRLPVEQGAFSLDGEGACHLDRSQLRYYSHPSRLNLDLKVGYDDYVPKVTNVPSDGLRPILRWINNNGDYFRPKVHSPTGVEGKNGEISSSDSLMGLGSPSKTERPSSLCTNFVSWRGMLTKLLCTPYNKAEPWKMAATLYNGTVYFSEIETEEKREREANQTPREREMCYWGYKFEDYMTTKEPPSSASFQNPKSASGSRSSALDKSGAANPREGFCTVVRTRMNTHSVVMAAEVDCCERLAKEKPPQNYVELKTSRVILTDRNKASFRRYKLMKWWAQSFLVGVPKIVCGFRNDDGIVTTLQSFKTAEIPRETQTDLSIWQPSVCLNFMDELLTWIRSTVAKDDPNTVYIIEWTMPYEGVSCRECPAHSEHVFLPEWYLNKLLHPPDNS